jgi:hypothetical protein
MRIGLRAALVAIALCTLSGMAWAGGLYYWHFKIERVLRYLEDCGPGGTLQPEMVATLDRAGCRALPNLMRCVRPDLPASYLHIITGQIVSALNQQPALQKQDCDLRSQRRAEFRVETDDKPAVVAAKCARLREWWAQHGTEVHQWWRFWTGSCRSGD